MKNINFSLVSIFIALHLKSIVAVSAVVPVTRENGNVRPLGAGYDSATQTLYQACVDNQTDDSADKGDIVKELPFGSFSLSLESSQDVISEKLGINAGGRYRTGATTISASAEFLNQTQSNSFSIAYTYVSEHLFQEVMNASRNHPIRPLPGFKDAVHTSDIFYQRCGDEYVRSREMAARLLININVSFVSKAERNRFAASFGIDSPVTTFKTEFEKDKSTFSANNRMSIRVIQIGGDQSKIGKILCPKNANGQPDPECEKNAKIAVDCSFGNIGLCTQLIANAIAYANAQEGENFPQQIKDGQNYSLVALHTAPYISLGEPFLLPPRRENIMEFEATVKQVSDIFESQYQLWSYSNKLYRGRAPRLSDRQKNEMEKLQNMHYKNLVRTTTAITKCYNLGYDVCNAELDNTRTYIGLDKDGSIEEKQYSNIEKLTDAEKFVQYCDIADDDHPDIKMTVNSLKAHAKEQLQGDEYAVKKLDEGDRCRNLSDWLENQTEIDMSDKSYLKIGSLAPLGSLINLQKLKLRAKKIKDISSLKNLINLIELDLDDNFISDVSSLSELKKLELLTIKNNNIDNLKLSVLSQIDTPYGALKTIDARGNSHDLTCPLADKKRCKLLDFSNSTQLISSFEDCSLRVGHQSVSIGDRVLVTGGYSMNDSGYYLSSMQVVGRDGCKETSSLLNRGRSGHTMTTLKGGQILVVGGHTNTLEIINPKTLISQPLNISMQDYRSQHTATLLQDGRVLIAGGYMDVIDFAVRSNHISNSFEIYNPQDGSLQNVGEMIVPRAEHTTTLLDDGRVLIIGGYSKNQMIDIVEIFDPKTNKVSILKNNLKISRSNHNAIKLNNGTVLISGGYDYETIFTQGQETKIMKGLKSLILFDPKLNIFRIVDDVLSEGRGNIQSSLMSDGRVLLVGGETKGAFFDGLRLIIDSTSHEIQIFDPASEAIYSAGQIARGRAWFTANNIGQDSIIVVGGFGDKGSYSSVELIVYRPK